MAQPVPPKVIPGPSKPPESLLEVVVTFALESVKFKVPPGLRVRVPSAAEQILYAAPFSEADGACARVDRHAGESLLLKGDAALSQNAQRAAVQNQGRTEADDEIRGSIRRCEIECQTAAIIQRCFSGVSIATGQRDRAGASQIQAKRFAGRAIGDDSADRVLPAPPIVRV